MPTLNVDTSKLNNCSTEQQYLTAQKECETLINEETVRKIAAVKGSEHYGIMTAAIIDGQWSLCSEYGLDEEMAEALEKA